MTQEGVPSCGCRWLFDRVLRSILMESWDYFYARIPEDFRFLNEILGPFSGIPFDVTSPLRLFSVSVNGSVNDPAGFSDFLCAGKGRALMTFQKAPKEWILHQPPRGAGPSLGEGSPAEILGGGGIDPANGTQSDAGSISCLIECGLRSHSEPFRQSTEFTAQRHHGAILRLQRHHPPPSPQLHPPALHGGSRHRSHSGKSHLPLTTTRTTGIARMVRIAKGSLLIVNWI